MVGMRWDPKPKLHLWNPPASQGPSLSPSQFLPNAVAYALAWIEALKMLLSN